MGIQYVNIDSRHRLGHEQKARLDVKLSKPIQNAKSVSVASFSVPNEFYNIIDNNNTLTIITQVYDSVILKPSVYTFNTGFFTIEDLVDDLSNQLSANGNFLSGDSTVKMFATYDIVANKVQFQFTGPVKTRAVIFFDENAEFENGVAFRMGFSRQQVIGFDAAPIWRVDNGVIQAVTYFKNRIEYVAEGLVLYDFAEPNISARNFIKAQNIGFETHSHLYLNSDLVNDFQINSAIGQSTYVSTVNTSILQKINVSVNRSSWIQYENFGGSSFEHMLDGRTISSFNISLHDSLNQVFFENHYRDYTVTLKFITHDDKSEINELAIEKVREMMFKQQHKCI